MSLYRIMSSTKRQLNQLQERLCYILIRGILIKLVLTLLLISQKNLNQFLNQFFTQEKQLYIFTSIHAWIYAHFNDHYLNPLIGNLSKESNKTIVLLGYFNIDLLNFDTTEYVSTFLDDRASNSLQPQILLPTRISNNSKTLIDNIFCYIPGLLVKSAMSGNVTLSISEHLPQFFILPEYLSKSSSTKYIIISHDCEKFLQDFEK